MISRVKKILYKVVLKKEEKWGLDFQMKNKPMVLGLLKVWGVFSKGLGWG
jgi:hypothetical protein